MARRSVSQKEVERFVQHVKTNPKAKAEGDAAAAKLKVYQKKLKIDPEARAREDALQEELAQRILNNRKR